MKLNYKTICKSLNAHAESNEYGKPATLRVEHTSFQAIHKAQRGRNGVGELVELVTQVISAKGVHIATHDRSNLISVYINAETRSGHGFGSDGGTFLRIRDAKGKYHSFESHKHHERDSINVEGFMRAIGEDTPSRMVPEEFEEFQAEELAKVVKIAGSEEDDSDWRRGQMVHAFAKKFYQDLVRYSMDDRSHGLDKLLAFAGASLVTMFQFTDRLWCISPDYVEQTRNGLEIGWTQRDTYNSLPSTLRITKTREIKTVKLCEIGVEESGYYNHGDNMRILPEAVPMVKRFARRFRAKQAKVTEQILESVRKAG